MRTIFRVSCVVIATIAVAQGAAARGFHHFGGGHQGLAGMHGMNGAAEARVGEAGHVDEAYAKAVSAEHERLLGKLKDICRGC